MLGRYVGPQGGGAAQMGLQGQGGGLKRLHGLHWHCHVPWDRTPNSKGARNKNYEDFWEDHFLTKMFNPDIFEKPVLPEIDSWGS